MQFPSDELRQFQSAWRQITGEEHDYLFNGTLEQTCCVGFFSKETGGRLDFWRKFPSDRVLIAFSTLCRKFNNNDRSRFLRALNIVKRWAYDSRLTDLIADCKVLRVDYERAFEAGTGFGMNVAAGANQVRVNLRESLDRLYNARVFHIDDPAKLDELQFLHSLVGVPAAEKANCYQSLLTQISAVCVLGEFVDAAIADPTAATEWHLMNSTVLRSRLRRPARGFMLQVPPPDFSRQEFPDESADIQEVYAFVDDRIKSLFKL